MRHGDTEIMRVNVLPTEGFSQAEAQSLVTEGKGKDIHHHSYLHYLRSDEPFLRIVRMIEVRVIRETKRKKPDVASNVKLCLCLVLSLPLSLPVTRIPSPKSKK